MLLNYNLKKMPSRGSYQIASMKEGEAAQRDQSYRSCIATLLIFFFLCVIFFLVSLSWRPFYPDSSQPEKEYAVTVQYYHKDRMDHERTEGMTSTTKSVKFYTNTTEASVVEKGLNEFETRANFDATENFNSITNESVEESTRSGGTANETTASEDTGSASVTAAEEILSESTRSGGTANETTASGDTGSASVTAGEEILSESTTKLATSTGLNSVTETAPESVATNGNNTMVQSTTEGLQDSVTYSTTIGTIEQETCTTGECKNLASKMLFYMNHTIDPCEDFYEYACGGFEANPQTVEWDLEDRAYQRIFQQMQKESGKDVSFPFAKYYNSCMRYENIKQSERIELARKVLEGVGKFYTREEWSQENGTSFTELLAKLLLHNSALLFDVAPDLDEYSPKQFTLKIGPTTYNNPFETDETNDPCYASQDEREELTVDLGKLYTEYKTCKNDTNKFIESVSEALKKLNVFHNLKYMYNISQYEEFTKFAIDFNIVQQFFAKFPSKDKIYEAYFTKNYTLVTIEELDRKFKVVNWTELICRLTKETFEPEVQVQIYFYDALAEGLTNLEQFRQRDPAMLHNALLGLYARNLYHELVLPKHQNAKKYCLHVAAHFLVPEASNLYISSFSKEQLQHMNETIHSLFETLKETLKLKTKEVVWATEKERNAMIAKIDNLKVAVPDISHYVDSSSIYKKNQTSKVNLTDNYFENSVILMQRYRKLIYLAGNPEQIWTHYATPYQSKGLAIYGLNRVVIPFGAIDWPIKYEELTFDYIKLATFGNVIAHQIAHHFDANGIYYWNGTRDAKNTLLNDSNSTNMNFAEYIDNQRNFLYQDRMSMLLPSTGQNVSYEISLLTLNERLSEIMGLRLAYDTLDRLRSSKEVNLPWLELDFDQLFYLTYAQMHCTKSPLTSSYISLYENEQLPSRIRIFVSASNNGLLGKAWNCPKGSRIMPSYNCSPFPYLQCKEATN